MCAPFTENHNKNPKGNQKLKGNYELRHVRGYRDERKRKRSRQVKEPSESKAR
jgi:hypothetical protein